MNLINYIINFLKYNVKIYYNTMTYIAEYTIIVIDLINIYYKYHNHISL